eukprot:jgi/Psemu1/252742/estExt_Genewise1Plus.C_560038
MPHSTTTPSCHIDRNVLDENTIEEMENIALSFFASACGKNRGAFVLDPPDGKTYGCLALPETMTELAGIEPLADANFNVTDANSIQENFAKGLASGADTISLLEFLVKRVYASTPSPESNAYACDVNGLAKLSCATAFASPRSDGAPIRSVTLVNLLVPDAPWAAETASGTDTGSEWSYRYTKQDFDEMKAMGLNTVQIFVPTSAFLPGGSPASTEVLTETLRDLEGSGLQAILSLVATGDDPDGVLLAADYASELASSGVVLGITLPRKSMLDTRTVVDSVRARIGPDLALFVPVGPDDLAVASKNPRTLGIDDPRVYGSLEWSHVSSVADIASSSSQEDRSKLFYHEAVACTMRSPIEHGACFGSKLPVFWSSGFDLSIDDCVYRDGEDFKDYGQCDRFDETIDSDWWQRHRASFAARQLFAAERGLGWSFAAWKVGESGSDSDEANGRIVDHPADLLSLKAVAGAGLFPDLSGSLVPAKGACLNPPQNDFVLGDDTLSPTMGPPPDCGNGWWNYTTSKCDYWVPPPEPTMAPTAACPVCDDCSTIDVDDRLTTAVLMGAVIAGIASTLICGVLYKVMVEMKKRTEYSPIPN